ncbi:Lcl C-terminal domain-containing protein [Pseudothauera rhizosphaerae]|uniref:Lcl C-terminal domain-containing protein n=1 Tax=Pseudothauera rhizosphaerae TaxID=2565932 RepID=UPI001454D5EE|nr:DUF1566 domain-containing protein [Pseudothauera rhizosphaerae]
MGIQAKRSFTGSALCAAACLLAACGPAPEPAGETTIGPLPAAAPARTQAEEQRLARLEAAALARFEARDDGTVRETAAGLLWMRCSLGQQWDGGTCTGEAQRYSWNQAQEAAAGARFGGHADWRLPARTELYGLVHCSSGMRKQLDRDGAGGGCAGRYHSPAILPAVFPQTPVGNFWSDTPHPQFSYSAWGVSFNTGVTGTGARNDYVYVRLVRDAR